MNVQLATSATAITTTGVSGVTDFLASAGVPDPANLSLILRASGVTGTTPSLIVEVTWSGDGTNFVSAGGTTDSFSALIANGMAQKAFTVKGRYARLSYTVTGTNPSFGLDAYGYAV
jgi:hypothetical protein